MGPQSKAQSKGTLPYVGQIGNNPLNDKNFLPPPPPYGNVMEEQQPTQILRDVGV